MGRQGRYLRRLQAGLAATERQGAVAAESADGDRRAPIARAVHEEG